LYEAMGVCTAAGGLESSLLAIEIEQAMFTSQKDPKAYAAKFRLIFTNLGDVKNQELRDDLFLGRITPKTLMNMTYEDLANPEKRRERRELEDYATECRKPTKAEATCFQFACEKCGQSETTYYQLQIRSADEPMTTFVTCVACGEKWTFE